MTDAREALRERVAEVIAKAWDDEGRVMAGADAAIAIVLEEAATTIAPPEMPPCRCVVWNNDGWFMECGCANNADIQEAAAWCARRNAAAEIRVLAAK